MATLDNAIWINGATGFAESGSTTLTESGNSTQITATFTANAWDETQGGNNISEFGAFAVTSPIVANYQFSNPIENLSFDINHVNDDGGSTFDDAWTIYVYDEDGNLMPSADVIAALSGIQDEVVTANLDGSVSIEATGTISNDISFNMAGPISEIELTFEPGPNGTSTGGSGISDLTFDIPPPDTDGDGTPDIDDIDDDNDGILDVDEGYSESSPTTLTITFDGDQWAEIDNTRWELRDPDGNLIASDTTINSTVEVTNVSISQVGDYTFTILDDFGDGLGGTDPASYVIEADGVVVLDSGPNPNFGSSITETFTVSPIITTTDSDGDGIADHLDLDSDNDGITDNVEAQATQSYVEPTGTDTDGDGLADAYDATPTTGAAGSIGLTLVDTDGDGTHDVLDTDSDDDGISDTDEAGHGVSQAAIDASGDSDGDGIADVVDDVVGADPNDLDYTGGAFTLLDTDGDVSADGTNAVPLTNDFDFRDIICFTKGTYIQTPAGERRIETLKPGDQIVTIDNGIQPIRWIGQRTVRATGAFAPIRFATGAYGNSRDLLVSPQHRMLVRGYAPQLLFGESEVLVPAKSLVNNFDVTIDFCGMVTYFHVLFDRHQIIVANGAPSESFCPGEMGLSALADCARSEIFALFPELKTQQTESFLPSRLCLKDREARSLAEAS